MFGIGGWEFVVIGIVALLVIGPEKLPRYAADAGRMLRQLRRLANSAQDEVRKELGPEFQDFSITDLNPKSFVKKHLLDANGLGEELRFDAVLDDDRPNPSRANGSSPTVAAAPASQNGDASEPSERGTPATPQSTGSTAPERVPYDPDAT